MLTPIEIRIADSEFGTERRARFSEIFQLNFRKRFAFIMWEIYHFNSLGEIIDNPDIAQARTVTTPINDENRVNSEGIIIIPEYYPTEEQYKTAYDAGTPEFTFWWTLLTTYKLPDVLSMAAVKLDYYKRFDVVGPNDKIEYYNKRK